MTKVAVAVHCLGNTRQAAIATATANRTATPTARQRFRRYSICSIRIGQISHATLTLDPLKRSVERSMPADPH